MSIIAKNSSVAPFDKRILCVGALDGFVELILILKGELRSYVPNYCDGVAGRRPALDEAESNRPKGNGNRSAGF